MNDGLVQAVGVGQVFRSGRLATPVLFDIDLTVARGEFLAVMGPSGCGKSTLMHILGMMLSPTQGRVTIDGCEASGLNEAGRARIRRDKIGFVFQRFNLLSTLTAYQNIAVAERIRGNAADGQVDWALETVGMEERAGHKPGQLSMGQQQRVAIARALCHRPDIVMADEPTGNLDSANAKAVLGLFRKIHEENGVTILMITHSETAASWAQRVVHMQDGRIRQ